jgi:cell pole-organizing protein PopZ
MKKMTALVASVAFAFGMVGFAAAQTPAAPAPPAEKKMDKKADKKADKLADCMAKAGTDDAKKADCEKKAAAAAKKAEKKAEKKDDAPKK